MDTFSDFLLSNGISEGTGTFFTAEIICFACTLALSYINSEEKKF